MSWLGNDRELAGRQYETIRAGLVRIFVSKGFSDAEDLADETINRVIVRLPDIRTNYRGAPACYFHGVARNIIRESSRRREVTMGVVEERVEPQPVAGEDHDCLGHCLASLPPDKRDLILDYYLYEGRQKIKHHKKMAGQLRITQGAIRSRAYQIRVDLENCIRHCQDQKLCKRKQTRQDQ